MRAARLAALIAALALSACGGGDESGPDPAPDGADDRTRVTTESSAVNGEAAPPGTTAKEIADCLKGAGLQAQYTDLAIGFTENERVVVVLDDVANGAEVVVFKSAADAREDRPMVEALYDHVRSYGKKIVVGFSPPAGPESEGAAEIGPCIAG